MNCKEGDLAIVVRSYAGNEGKIVQCLELLRVDYDHYGKFEDDVPSWRIDRPLANALGQFSYIIPDNQLRPLNPPGPEEDVLHVEELDDSLQLC